MTAARPDWNSWTTLTALCGVLSIGAVPMFAQRPVPAASRGPLAGASCEIAGRIVSGQEALPGVAVVVQREKAVVAVTSTDLTGHFRAVVPAVGTYRLSTDLLAFAPVSRTVTVVDPTCRVTMDFELTLASRQPPTETSPPVGGEFPERVAPASARTAPPGAGRRGGAGRRARAGAAARFESLDVELDGALAGALDLIPEDTTDAAARLLLPPGFSAEGATEALAVQGDGVDLDRGLMRERLQALGRGEFAAAGAVLPDGVLPGRAGGFGGGGPFAGLAGQGFRGRGGGGFLGRGLRGQNRYQGTTTYTFGGSALDAAPYALRSGARTERDYTQQQYGTSVGGPLQIPGVYDGSRTSFFVTVQGNRTTDLNDQYATVPTGAVRQGDFSGSAVPVIDPRTGVPFSGNRIPVDRLDPGALSLLAFVPDANLPGDEQNYQTARTSHSTGDTVSLRVTQNFSANAGEAGRGGLGGGFGRGRGGRGGDAGATAVVLNAQVQYRRNESASLGTFASVDGNRSSSSLAVPVGVNVLKGRTVHNLQVDFSRTRSESRNQYAGFQDVAGLAGIVGVATDPFAWGIPDLSFSSYTSLRDVTPSLRTDSRLQLRYTVSRPTGRHRLQFGGEYSRDRLNSQSDANARGSFVFTGLYTGGPNAVARGSGLDFADFLLGLPQQASVQYGPGEVQLRGWSLGLFVQDNWRASAGLTLNLGVRYELTMPFTEAGGRMVGLDVTPDFTAAAPVLAGGDGRFTGAFPASLVHADTNNVAPRVGLAWRATQALVVRTGFGVSFNNGSYGSIARQLVAQPPFAVTSTTIGSLAAPLTLADPFAEAEPSATTNNYGIDKNYQLGIAETWNFDVDRRLARGWTIGGGYTGTKGTHLDILRAPNRDADGLRIEGVQPFLWQTSEGTSLLHAGTARLRKSLSSGVGGSVTYTLARSIDNASTVGGGTGVVAQDDRDLEAERGLSSFDRRHQLSADLLVELPFGEGRRWLDRRGILAAALGGWSLNATWTAESGTPYTARVVGSADEVARGTSGTLRADATGAPVGIDNPTILRYFNTDAFIVPAPGTFGNAGRNTIVGPGNRQLNMRLTRDVRIGSTQVMSVSVNASNVLNAIQYAAIDTVVNSPTFGQVVAVRPMRSVRLDLRFRY